jgi:DNA-binding transcriptional MerR regulator
MNAVLTIRQMCDHFHVTARTLRFYEDKELISPNRVGQKRLYTKREIGRVKLILRGKRFGFSLEEIRELLDLYYIGDQQKTQVKRTVELGKLRLAELEDRRTELDEAIVELKEQLIMGEEWLGSSENRESLKA